MPPSAKDNIIVATPVDLARLIAFPRPIVVCVTDLEEISHPNLLEVVSDFLGSPSRKIPI